MGADDARTDAVGTPESEDSRGDSLSSDILMDPKRAIQDIKLITDALDRRFPITPRRRRGIVSRLWYWANKTEVVVPTKDGTVHAEGPAGSIAVAALRALTKLEEMNQADEHHSDKMQKHDPGVNLNIGIASASPVLVYLPDNGRDKPKAIEATLQPGANQG